MELCCACAWLLSDERELVNLLARGANIIVIVIQPIVLKKILLFANPDKRFFLGKFYYCCHTLREII